MSEEALWMWRISGVMPPLKRQNLAVWCVDCSWNCSIKERSFLDSEIRIEISVFSFSFWEQR